MALIEPNAQAAAAPVEPAAPAAPDEGGASLPPELIQIPALQALLAGQPPAVSTNIKEFNSRPEAQLIEKHVDPLMQAGIGFYRSLSGDLGVMFNRMFLADTELQEADKAGSLDQIAPSFDEVNQAVGASGAANPVLQDSPRPTGLKTAGAPAPGPMPAPAASRGKLQQKVIGAKQRNLAPGSPTSGPKPGAGRLLNSILKPVL